MPRPLFTPGKTRYNFGSTCDEFSKMSWMLRNKMFCDLHMTSATERYLDKLDVHGSVHHNINLMEITNKMRPCSKIYYSNFA